MRRQVSRAGVSQAAGTTGSGGWLSLDQASSTVGLTQTRTSGPRGAHTLGSVTVNIASVEMPEAAARWVMPLSFPTNSVQRLNTADSCRRFDSLTRRSSTGALLAATRLATSSQGD